MGIIEKQSKHNIVILAFAVFFGALNNIVLFPIALSKEEWGIIRFLPTVAIIISNVALLGSPQILLRYMPSFQKKDKSNGGLFWLNLKLLFTGLTIMIILLIVFKPNILSVYEENASRLSDFYNYIFPLLILNAFVEFLSAFSRANLLSVFQLFLREIFHRIIQSLLLILVMFNWISFETFILAFSFSLALNAIVLLVFLKKEGVLDWRPYKIEKTEKLKIYKYGGANLLTGLGATLTSRIDSLMIAAFVSVGVVAYSQNGGLEAVAIYAFGAYMVSVVDMPARAISNIANTIIAKAWENKDMHELSSIYKKTSINQMVVSGLLFVLIWAGIDELFELIGGYQEAKWVVLFLGIGKLINISFGAISSIIMSSKFYIYAMYLMVVLAILTYILNLLFIPMYGIEGAAIATTISIFTYFILSFLILKVKTGLQPFSLKTVKLLFIGVALFYFAHVIDFGLHPLVEIVIMSTIIVVLYVGGVFALNISPEINQTIRNVFNKSCKHIARKIVFPLVYKIGAEKKLNKVGNNVLNVMYHGVVDSNKKGIKRNISATKFEKHLVYLKKNFDIISLEEFKNNASEDRDRQAVTLSFDDGYENNLTVLLPLLERYQVSAAVYVLGFVADSNCQNIRTVWSNYIDVLLAHNEINELNSILGFKNGKQKLEVYYNHVKNLSSDEMKTLLFDFESSKITNDCLLDTSQESYKLMTREQVVELSKSPLITIGSHAYSHCNLSVQNRASQIRELKDSKEQLEQLIGREVTSLAYPDGSYTRETLDYAKELGYTDQWAVRYNFEDDKDDGRIFDRFGMPTQTTFESNMIFLQKAFNKHSHGKK